MFQLKDLQDKEKQKRIQDYLIRKYKVSMGKLLTAVLMILFNGGIMRVMTERNKWE